MHQRVSTQRSTADDRVSPEPLCRCDHCRQVLHAIHAEIEQLRAENQELHKSARFFADLSERLNTQLRRRQG
jgi:hypothetical protein